MQHITDRRVIVDLTPLDLWRNGNASTPRMDKIRVPPNPRTDVTLRPGVVPPRVLPMTGGISLFDALNPTLIGGVWWVISAGTRIPPGLALTADAEHRGIDARHYTIHAQVEMPLAAFVERLVEFGQFAIKHCVNPAP